MKTLQLTNLPFGSNVLIAYTPLDTDIQKIPQENHLYLGKPTGVETGIIRDIDESRELTIRVRCAGDHGFFKPLQWKGFLPEEDNIGVVTMSPDLVEDIAAASEINFITI